VAAPRPQSEAHASEWGLLELTLRHDGYDWRFVGVPGVAFSDSGTSRCH
jgi:hypothetical protein